jgi:hypothetical protein
MEYNHIKPDAIDSTATESKRIDLCLLHAMAAITAGIEIINRMILIIIPACASL